MKTILTLLMLIPLSYELCFSQGHISPCGGSASHGTANCYGYATGRVAGREAGDAACNPVTFALDVSRMGDYYNYTTDASLTSLQTGDLVRFSDHVGYVVEVGTPRDSTKVDHFYSVTQEEKNVSIKHVKDLGHGNWIGYHRRKIIQTSVTTDPSGGQLLIDG